MNLFDWLQRAQELASQSDVHAPGSLAIEAEFKAALTEDIKHARGENGKELSRYQVAARMSELLGRDITKDTLDNWTARSHPHNMPAVYIPAFVIATGGRRAFEVLSRHSGLFALPGPEALRAEIQRLDEEMKRLKGEKRKRQTFLREVEG